MVTLTKKQRMFVMKGKPRNPKTRLLADLWGTRVNKNIVVMQNQYYDYVRIKEGVA